MDAAAQLQIPYQEQSDQCCPNLNLERIGRGADKSLDSKVLLERLKQQLSGKGLARYTDARPVSSPSP